MNRKHIVGLILAYAAGFISGVCALVVHWFLPTWQFWEGFPSIRHEILTAPR